ncbi:O-antigen ligase family protein [Shewanella sp. A3A]|nr:O-antigen ligase family protein [Shewanella ferrihydritica]
MKLGMFLIFLIAFLGPTGKFFIPLAGVASFRLFYIFSFLFLIYYLFFLGRNIKTYKTVLLVFFLYAILLVSIFINIGSYNYESINMNPVVRVSIHATLIFSFFFLSEYLNVRGCVAKVKYIKFTFYGYILLLFLGFFVYFLYISGLISESLYSSFNIISQEAYGYTRFTPGTYPNEFGTMASFFTASFIVMILNFNQCAAFKFIDNKVILWCVCVVSFLGFILATTRSAYLTFIISIIYIVARLSIVKALYFVVGTTIIILSFLFLVDDSFLTQITGLVNAAYSSAASGTGSISARYEAWDYAYYLFSESPFLGVGFGNEDVALIHNVYLQFLFGLGVVLFPIYFLVFFISSLYVRNKITISDDDGILNKSDRIFFRDIMWVGVIHVALFATNNHNQNHFLTWFVFSLVIMSKHFLVGKIFIFNKKTNFL